MLKRLNERTWQELAALDKLSVRLVLPIASMEQHATHLPVGTDDFISCIAMDAIIDNESLEAEYWLLPAIHYGCSFEHMAFPGTFSLSPATICAIVEDILGAMSAHGWKTLVLVNSHGGNQGILQGMAQTWRYRFGVNIYQIDLLKSARPLLLDDLELPPERDGHAGEVETSVLMSGMPGMVNREALKLQPDMLDALPEYKYSWLTHEMSTTGILGGVSKASAEKGDKIIEAVINSTIRILTEIALDGKGE
ncbi:MAG: Creatinine amidohydrolase [Firmicutes bacterium ADurb.Bin182]|nr:MAG: Creatinine amidohydrolase [Firmicutes bacterium ADurb.Bin182]